MAQVASAQRAASAPRVASGRKRSATAIVGRVLFYLLVAIVLFYTLAPFYWAFRSSITPTRDLFTTPVQYFPANPTWEHYRRVLGDGLFQNALKNSAAVALSVTLVSLVIGAFAAYALGRFRFRGRTPILYVILSMTMFPQIAILGALFQLIQRLNLYNRGIAFTIPGTRYVFNTHILPGLVLTYLIFTLPFTVWVLTSFFKQMPGALEEAAYVDGATPFQTFYKVLLPLAMPGMVTTGLLAFIAAWNEFLFALSFTQTPDKRVVNLAIFYFSGTSGNAFDVPWGQIMAATVIVTVPIVILVLIFQRLILAGLTAGAVKG